MHMIDFKMILRVRNCTFIAVLHFTLTIGSSILSRIVKFGLV
jgi:hypothetical protein